MCSFALNAQERSEFLNPELLEISDYDHEQFIQPDATYVDIFTNIQAAKPKKLAFIFSGDISGEVDNIVFFYSGYMVHLIDDASQIYYIMAEEFEAGYITHLLISDHGDPDFLNELKLHKINDEVSDFMAPGAEFILNACNFAHAKDAIRNKYAHKFLKTNGGIMKSAKGFLTCGGLFIFPTEDGSWETLNKEFVWIDEDSGKINYIRKDNISGMPVPVSDEHFVVDTIKPDNDWKGNYPYAIGFFPFLMRKR